MNNPFKFDKPKDSLDSLLGAPKTQIVRDVSMAELKEIINQPFNPYSDEALEVLVEDIKENGLLSPLVVAPIDGGYEILAGRNRYRACKELGMEKVPCIVRNNLNQAKRNLILVASNLKQRQQLLPSEKAKAYKMQQDACKELNIAFKPELIESTANVYKYLRLNNLTDELLKKLDDNNITFTIAYEISRLSHNAQSAMLEYLNQGNEVSVNGINKLSEYDKNNVDITTQLIELCESTVVPAFKSVLTVVNSNNEASEHSKSSFNGENSAVAKENQSSQGNTNAEEKNSNKADIEDKKSCEDKNNYSDTSITNKLIPLGIDDDSSDETQHENNSTTIGSTPKQLNDDDELVIKRFELPWTLKRNCDMQNLKELILSEIITFSNKYFEKYKK